MHVPNPLIAGAKEFELPAGTTVYNMSAPAALADPVKAVADALEHPIASKPLRQIAKEKLAGKADATAVIVIDRKSTRLNSSH